jgi:S-ribosylhomocysteine lyase LuxS involved in autoinducer biosynthesis
MVVLTAYSIPSVFVSKTRPPSVLQGATLFTFSTILQSVPNTSTIDCGEADCRLHNQAVVIRSPTLQAGALSARAGPLVPAVSVDGCKGAAQAHGLSGANRLHQAF